MFPTNWIFYLIWLAVGSGLLTILLTAIASSLGKKIDLSLGIMIGSIIFLSVFQLATIITQPTEGLQSFINGVTVIVVLAAFLVGIVRRSDDD